MIRNFLKLFFHPIVLSRYFKETLLFCNKLDIKYREFTRYFLQFMMNSKDFFMYRNNMISLALKMSNYDDRLGGWIDDSCGIIIYIIVRHVKPEIVVETGVGPGGTTSFILKALEDNQKGELLSIDLPGYDDLVYPYIGKCGNLHIPKGLEVGWLVPPWLKHRHKLIIGNSKEKLPELLSNLGTSVDIFMHDSLHTDEHILFELNTVLPHMTNNGIMLCDDVNDYWSFAFVEFCKIQGFSYLVFNNRLGICRVCNN